MNAADALYDEAGFEEQDDVQRWLQQAFAAERAPVRRAMPVPPAAAPAACRGCRGFYLAMLGATLLTWLFA